MGLKSFTDKAAFLILLCCIREIVYKASGLEKDQQVSLKSAFGFRLFLKMEMENVWNIQENITYIKFSPLFISRFCAWKVIWNNFNNDIILAENGRFWKLQLNKNFRKFRTLIKYFVCIWSRGFFISIKRYRTRVLKQNFCSLFYPYTQKNFCIQKTVLTEIFDNGINNLF